VNPLYGLIEADTQTNFYKAVENKNVKSDTDCDQSFHDCSSVESNEISQKKGSLLNDAGVNNNKGSLALSDSLSIV
jgi:hypothetical protein